MSDRCMSGFPFVSCALCLFMTFYPRVRVSKFRDLLESYEEVRRNAPYSEHAEAKILQQSKIVRSITKVLVMLEFCPMFIIALILPIVNEMTDFAFGERKLSIPSRFPFDPLASFASFLPVMILHTSGAVFVNFKKIAFEETFFIFLTRHIAMVNNLKYNLEMILDSLSVDDQGRLTNGEKLNDASWRYENIQKPLKKWAQNHQECLRIFRDLEALYSWPLAIYFALTTLILCTAAYVTAEINELNHALTGKNTFLLNKTEHGLLKLILTRCRQDSIIKAVSLFPLSVDTFKSVLTTSYSYMVMIKIVNGEEDKS
uniref:Odorant receptor 2 n=1 Tax=Cyrtorhinus lividipennis TaxID=1032904 RepID=A0A346TI10_9HEMI|nr:odorant receptor 2 [Cyrtorhinus lividipennis]